MTKLSFKEKMKIMQDYKDVELRLAYGEKIGNLETLDNNQAFVDFTVHTREFDSWMMNTK